MVVFDYNLQKKISKHVASGTRLYHLYLSNGKSYYYAKALKRNNDILLTALNGIDLSRECVLNNCIQALIYHLRNWAQKWENLEQTKAFSDSEPFVFSNYVRFPKDDVEFMLSIFEF